MQQDIVFTLKEVAYDVSEAAICENLIYPILKEAWKRYVDIFAFGVIPVSYTHLTLPTSDLV